ncbi:MAG: tRNA (adenosine(37)-N6)-threonylcarbamoyltransferase complex ATPase subunit type 1 TsaE [bacterium]|nr:tRNA (adenosine(37)-N6)-threonylcarbamoyltransferase complex ATPase subunit type 1 TsaE [bacterium]
MNMEREFKACSEMELAEAADYLRENLHGRKLVFLYGELGSGKTAFVRAYAKQFGISNVMSPTFNLLHVYRSESFIMTHVDLYRIEKEKHFLELNLEDYIDDSDVTFVEWPERAKSLLEKYPLTEVRIVVDERCRRINILW